MIEKLDLEIHAIKDLKQNAKAIINFLGDSKVVLFYGQIGSGKTTLIKEICYNLGSSDNLSSPSYAIVNEYSYKKGKIFHFDLFRIKNKEELIELGIDEYIYSGHYCFFEWPDLVLTFIESKHVKIEISIKNNIRYLCLQKF